MKNLSNIGIDKKKSAELSKKLNLLLADYQVFYTNLRGFHWNIKGEKFFELHLKFEELYNDVILKIDEIAERILTLGGTPANAYTEYLKVSEIKEVTFESDGKKAVESVLKSFQVLLVNQRELLEMSGDAGDEGTNALMSDYIREQEKLVWMLSAFLGK
jgi:starvation-inducible DNA-binding protein